MCSICDAERPTGFFWRLCGQQRPRLFTIIGIFGISSNILKLLLYTYTYTYFTVKTIMTCFFYSVFFEEHWKRNGSCDKYCPPSFPSIFTMFSYDFLFPF